MKSVLETLYAVIYLFAVPSAIITLAIIDLHGRQQTRAENRRAIILVARSSCEANAAFKKAALLDAKTDAAQQRIEDFFADFEAPLNRALHTLGAPGCQETGG